MTPLPIGRERPGAGRAGRVGRVGDLAVGGVVDGHAERGRRDTRSPQSRHSRRRAAVAVSTRTGLLQALAPRAVGRVHHLAGASTATQSCVDGQEMPVIALLAVSMLSRGATEPPPSAGMRRRRKSITPDVAGDAQSAPCCLSTFGAQPTASKRAAVVRVLQQNRPAPLHRVGGCALAIGGQRQAGGEHRHQRAAPAVGESVLSSSTARSAVVLAAEFEDSAAKRAELSPPAVRPVA